MIERALESLAGLGPIGVAAGVAVALVFALVRLPLVGEFWREVAPRRIRWLARSRELVSAGGEFGLTPVLDREIEREVVARLCGMKLTPQEFAVLREMNATHPRDASWRAIKEWADSIEFRDGNPCIQRSRALLAWGWFSIAMAYSFVVVAALFLAAALLVYALDRNLAAATSVALSSLVPMFLAVTIAYSTQSPYRWHGLDRVFRAAEQAAAAARQ